MALVTLANLKTYLMLPDTYTDEDDKLEILIAAVNLGIDAYVGRRLEKTVYVHEVYDGTGSESLCLRNYPIISIEQVFIMGYEISYLPDRYPPVTCSGISPYVVADPPVDFVFPTNEVLSSSIGYYYLQGLDDGVVFHSTVWPSGRNILTVNYTAGFDPMPADIVAAALEMASFYRSVTQKTGIMSESLGSYSTSLMTTSNMEGGLTIPSILFRMILDRYRCNFYPHLIY
jgi:hypothetical protein